MKLSAKLPFKMQLILGKLLGRLLYLVLKKRRKIALINITKCFPEKNKNEVNQLVHRHLEAIGMSLFDTANAYFAKSEKIQQLTTFDNQHYLVDALKNKQNIILLSGHFTALMLGGRPLLWLSKMTNIYRPQNNLLFDQVMRQSFITHGANMVKVKDTRSMVKSIKSGVPIWYAADQDMGEKHCIFAPFFNIQTATVTATARLAKIPNTVVIPYFFIRTANGYVASFEAPLQNYPSGDAVKDARVTNQILQNQILKMPEQYLWIHKRFKTRPKGEKSFY